MTGVEQYIIWTTAGVYRVSRVDCTLCTQLVVTDQPNLNLTQLQVGVTLKLVSKCLHPTNFSPTSMQPRAMKFGIQAQLNLLIKAGKKKVGSPDPTLKMST